MHTIYIVTVAESFHMKSDAQLQQLLESTTELRRKIFY